MRAPNALRLMHPAVTATRGSILSLQRTVLKYHGESVEKMDFYTKLFDGRMATEAEPAGKMGLPRWATIGQQAMDAGDWAAARQALKK